MGVGIDTLSHRQAFSFDVTVNLTFDLMTPKIIRGHIQVRHNFKSSLRAMGAGIVQLSLETSDNFSFQNNGIKKCTCLKTMRFFEKQWVFQQCF